MKKKVLAILLCGCLAGTVFVGCSSTSQSTTAADGTEAESNSETTASAEATTEEVTSVTSETNDANEIADELAALAGDLDVSVTLDFGRYEQDNDESNGAETIEWIVLAKDGDKMLVVSKYGLDCQPYNTKYKDVTWKTSSLRKWLNSTFLNSAFTAEEQDCILETKVKQEDNTSYYTEGGKSTKDKIFLLSNSEVEKYLTEDSDAQCEATEYAKANGAYVNDETGCSWWWLRTPGYNAGFANYVKDTGGASEDGDVVDQDEYVVRPAMWISLSGITE